MPLMNKSQCRKYMMDYSRSRARPFTRVGQDVYDRLESVMREHLRYAVDMSIGKTITFVTHEKGKQL